MAIASGVADSTLAALLSIGVPAALVGDVRAGGGPLIRVR